MNISESLKMAMLERGLNNEELGDRIGVSKQQISNWRCDHGMTLGSLVRLCEGLDCKVSVFIALCETQKKVNK